MNALPNPFLSVAPPSTDEPVTAPLAPTNAVAGSPIPAGYVLVERELVGWLLKRSRMLAAREQLPAFLSAPSRGYLEAVRRA